MEVWGFMEMIHSRSYTYIIKNVYSDPSEVFDKILDDENILRRAKSVTKAYDEFIRAAQEYSSGNMWQHQLEGVPAAKDTLYELWKDPLKLSLSSQETKASILSSHRILSRTGITGMTQTCSRLLKKSKKTFTKCLERL
jgi:hypothetical protein